MRIWFCKRPKSLRSSDTTRSGKYTANEAQRDLLAQQEGNYNVIPTFNIITIFIALFCQSRAAHLYCVQSQYMNFKLIMKQCILKHLHLSLQIPLKNAAANLHQV